MRVSCFLGPDWTWTPLGVFEKQVFHKHLIIESSLDRISYVVSIKAGWRSRYVEASGGFHHGTSPQNAAYKWDIRVFQSLLSIHSPGSFAFG